MIYPSVISEFATMALVAQGRSLARYGDGEFALASGRSIPCQVVTPALRHRLQAILCESGDCLVGIPNLHVPSPKADYWQRQQRARDFLVPRNYVSAFVSRPDSAPWIDTPEYWAQLESLWVGQDVTLVRGSVKSLTAADLKGARSVTEVLCSRQNAFGEYDVLLERIGTPARVLLCCGPTATVLAVDLCEKGSHAIDLGHVGMFLRKHRSGQPMIRTDADKVA